MIGAFAEMLGHGFMVRALLAGLAVASLSPAMGVFLVLRRLSLIADTIAHVALAGVAIGLVASIFPPIAALIVAVVAATGIEYLRTSGRLYGEAALALFLYAALALAVVLISLGPGFSGSLFGYLFGSILTVRTSDVVFVWAMAAVALGFVLFFYRELTLSTFDQDLAHTAGVPVRWVNMLLAVLTAVTIVVAMQVVGVLLVGALMVIPTIASLQLGLGFRATVLTATVVGLGAVLVGLTAAYFLGLPAGGAIVLACVVALAGVSAIQSALRLKRRAVR